MRRPCWTRCRRPRAPGPGRPRGPGRPPAAAGGAAAGADAPTVLDALPPDLVARFEQEGWLLTRSYKDEIGASVAEAFGTDDRAAVESYCRANAIEFEWQPDGGLRTRQRRS